jgi:hypothetical protein
MVKKESFQLLTVKVYQNKCGKKARPKTRFLADFRPVLFHSKVYHEKQMDSLTREQAKAALLQGKTVAHNYYTSTEHLQLVNGILITEDGCRH